MADRIQKLALNQGVTWISDALVRRDYAQRGARLRSRALFPQWAVFVF
jgi:hypothetical protein